MQGRKRKADKLFGEELRMNINPDINHKNQNCDEKKRVVKTLHKRKGRKTYEES